MPGFVSFVGRYQICELWDIHNDERVNRHALSAFGWRGGDA